MDWISKRASLSPNKLALIDIEQNRSLTYNQLNERSTRWASFFLSKHIQKGDRIAVLAVNQAEIFEIIFACAKIGAIMVPINWRLTPQDIAYILEDSTPTILLYHEKFVQVINELNINNAQTFQEFEETINQEPSFHKIQGISNNDPWFIIYTGGTTGKPKGVVLSHESVDWNALNTIVSWGLTADEITLTYMPLFHTGGINALSLPILMNGGTVVIGNKFNPGEALIYLKKYKCTIALFVPTMYHMMQQTEEFEQLDFPDMKVFLSGGAPCPLTIYEKFAAKGYRFKEGYGLTEAGPNNFFITPEEASVKKGSVGKAMMFNDVKIIRENGTEITDTKVGELLVRGKHGFIKYWNKPTETSETWMNGWIHTGDLARRDEDGYFYIVGRKKDMIITGGENVYPLEIEQWFNEHPAVNEVAVVGIPDDKWGERVAAFVSLYNGSQVTEYDLKDYCSRKLAKYKIPKSIIVLDEIPKTPVGKIDKKQLKELEINKAKN